MTAKRLLLGWVVGLWAAGAAVAQTMPPAKPLPPPPVPDAPSAAAVLTAPPGQPSQPVTQLPPGTVTSPGCPSGNCCGPTGANGPLTYELVAFTGPSLPVAGGVFSGKLNVGWGVGGQVRTLYMNPDATAAWVLNLGLTFIYNRGQQNIQFEVLTPSPTRNADGTPAVPDALTVNVTRGLSRTSFDYGIGRDWWLRGPAAVGAEQTWNSRFGVDVGGRWGTSHVDLVPILDRTNYLRRSSIFHSVNAAAHLDWEVPMGSWVFVSGFRAEWDYTWTNLIPPSNGDIVSVNLWLTAGVRY